MTKPSFSRKNFFIDRNLQGRYMVTFLVPMLIMLAFMLLTLYLASQTMVSASSKIMKREIENTIATETQDRPEPTVEQYARIVEQVRMKARGFSSNEDMRKEFTGTLLWVFGAGILLVLMQVVMMTVFFSHKLAGPVYRFEKACRHVINGNYNDVITLRKGDQMQGLALLLNEAMRSSGKRIIDLEARIAELEARAGGKGAEGKDDKAD
jgi:nitrogen fixation/metabolism regulation signal transduction histidine kinase